MIHAVPVVFAKEVTDNLRDRRSLLTALIYPLLGPLLFAVLLHVLGGVVAKATRGVTLDLPVAGAEHAPRLIAWLETHEVRVRPLAEDPERAVRGGLEQVVMVLPEGFEAALDQGGMARVRLINDASRLAGELLVGRLADLLRAWSRELSAARLGERGLDSEVLLDPVKIDNLIVVQRGNALDLFLFMVPPFVMFTVFIGGVYLAIDTTSGERERGSLEPLFANPVPRWQFMMGKFLAAYLFTAVALAVQLGAFALVFQTVGAGMFSRGNGFGLGTVAYFMAVGVPLMAFTVAIQIIIAALTRSFKEAQTWLGLLPLLPAVPGLAMVFVPVRAAWWSMAVPVFSQTVTMQLAVRGEPVSAAHLALSAIATLAAAVLLLRWAARLFEREEMVFGG